jgi:hypothetical protein
MLQIQSYSRLRKIKNKMQIFIFSLLISSTHSFIQFPFTANSFLENFFNAVQNQKIKTFSEVDDSEKLDIKNMIAGTECYRKCKTNDRKICHFLFILQFFHTAGG